MILFSTKQRQEILLIILFAYSAESLAPLITHFFILSIEKSYF